MKRNQLFVLGGIAVAALAVALLLNTGGGGSSAPRGVGEPLLPGLDRALNDVDTLTIREGDASITLTRTQEGWQVQEADGYAANIGNVRELLLSLAESTLLEVKTSNPENYATLGLQPPAEGGTTVSITAGEGWDGATVALGNTARQGEATYVRRNDEASTWLASGGLSASAQTRDWVETQILDIPATRVQAVTIEHADGERVEIAKASRDATGFTLADVPTGKELRYESIANPIGGVLGGLRLEDVQSRDSADPASDATVTRFVTFDGLEITARAWQDGDSRRVAFSAAYDAAQAQRFASTAGEGDTTGDADGEQETGPDGEQETGADGGEETGADGGGDAGADDVAAEAQALQTRLAPWVFTIGSYKFDQLTRRMDDLVQDPPPTPDAG